MKKSIFGYNVAQADSVIDSLKTELAASKDDIKSLQDNALTLKKQCDEFETKLAALENEKQEACADAETSRAEIAELHAENAALKNYVNDINEKKLKLDAEHENITYISQKVYGEMIEMRRGIIDETNDSIDEFSSSVAATNTGLKDALSRIDGIKCEAILGIEAALEKFRSELEFITDTGKGIESALIDVDKMTNLLKQKTNTVYYRKDEIKADAKPADGIKPFKDLSVIRKENI